MAERNAVDLSKVLLVEAESDRGLFEQIFKALSLNPEIRVACPREINPESRNGKQAVFNLTSILLKQFADSDLGEQRKLAVVIDADYETEGGLGYGKTVEQFIEIVGGHDFELATEENNSNGLVFRHPDQLADLGLWVMPNNVNDGMLEDWLKACVHEDEQALFNHAESVVESLEPKKFKPIHQTKAEIATWLAWQDQPGHGLYQAQKANLLDKSKPLYSQLTSWLTRIYT